MRTVQAFQVDVFTKTPFEGNPAAVVLEADGLPDEQIQRIVRELHNGETAFVFASTGPDHDVLIRFFTQTCETPVCGHATIAAIYVLAKEKGLPPSTVRMKCQVGTLPVKVERQGDDYRVYMTQAVPQFEPPLNSHDLSQVLNALGTSESELRDDCPAQVVSTGHSKLLIPMKTRQAVNQLKPDFEALAQLSSRLRTNGYFVFTLDSPQEDVLTEGRMFSPAIGVPEDPVTGNANGALGAYLVHHRLVTHDGRLLRFNSLQGRTAGRPGLVRVEVDIEHGQPKCVRVGDRAVIVGKRSFTM